jgi:hypothetical protein
MSTVDSVLAAASAELGKPYVFGAEGPDAFDCSGLTQWAYGQAGLSLPRTAAEQQAATSTVASPAPGDLVFYGSPAHHVGIYLGAGKMIDAPDVGKPVRIEGVGTPTNYGRVSGAGAGIAGVAGGLGAAASGILEDLLGGARSIALEGAFIGLGALLVGLGLWRAVKAARDNHA